MPRAIRWGTYLLCASILGAGFAHAAIQRRSAAFMAEAATAFLNSLDEGQRAAAQMSFEDDERLNWFYTPVARKGLTFGEMRPAQIQLAHALMNAGLSQRGYMKATTIMSLEAVLDEVESRRRSPRPGFRDSEKYHFSIFGDPAGEDPWGWRVEGHHVSLNFTLAGGRVTATSPAFFGANPHRITEGPRAGLRPLGAEEDRGRALLAALGDDLRARAIVSADSPRDILTANSREASLEGGPEGVRASDMNEAQRELLRQLIGEYAGNAPEEEAVLRRERARASWPEGVWFSWRGSAEPGEPNYYQVRGEGFLIEYDNTQGDANHSHTVWREFDGDWGADLLAAHYAAQPHN